MLEMQWEQRHWMEIHEEKQLKWMEMQEKRRDEARTSTRNSRANAAEIDS